MDDGAYISFLVLGIALVLVDGQIIYRSGLRYLGDSYGDDQASAGSMARLVSVLFHFAVLGLLALISIIDVGGDGLSAVQAVVLKLGIVLVVLAIAHGVTIKVLNRMRDRIDAENLTKKRYADVGTATPPAGQQVAAQDQVVAPNPDVPVRHEPVVTNDPTTPARFKAVQPGDPEIPVPVQEKRGAVERPMMPEKR
ncbi:hypothetical protein [Actinokineospora bangkokensis]|uniref:Uncharacterized protein n=1 Tax=Actinokineospora bangkokensis TaxID=1193682 RepID=A0A1Q9LKW0_9PSEU|nr:hypothetical protein [Actinokineospora bangkokensis]OLR92672.1 hypothetical protein BJP25_21835 [Actinokineospora bangkokensis]